MQGAGPKSRNKEMRHSIRSRFASNCLLTMTPSTQAANIPSGIDAATADTTQPVPVVEVRDGPSRASTEFQRIDRPHADVGTNIGKPPVAMPASRKPSAPSQRPVQIQRREDQASGSTKASSLDRLPDSWLHLHATDLIDRLADWSADLDSREAELNARIAKQDLRERQFRLQQQVAQTEMDEQQRSIDRLRTQIQAHARRLAFQD